MSHGPRGILRRSFPIGLAAVILAALLVLPATPRLEAAGPPVSITEFGVSFGAVPLDISPGPDGNVWFTENGTGAIGRITPTGSLSEFSAMLDHGGPRVKPVSLCLGADLNIWFTYDFPLSGTDTVAPGVAAMNRFGTVLGHYDFPSSFHSVKGIAPGLDGALWIAMTAPSSAILRMTTGGAFTAYLLPDSTSGPNVIRSFGSGGHYFTETGGQALAHIALDGTVTEYPITPTDDYQPVGVALGSTGLWVSESHKDEIGLFDSRTLAFTHYPLATGSVPWGMAGDAFSGGAWFCEYGAGKIGHIHPGGRVTEYPLPSPTAGPRHITIGPDGDVWFTEALANKVGHLAAPGPPKLPG